MLQLLNILNSIFPICGFPSSPKERLDIYQETQTHTHRHRHTDTHTDTDTHTQTHTHTHTLGGMADEKNTSQKNRGKILF